VTIEITDLVDTGDFTLQVRIPGWATGAAVAINGEALPPSEAASGQYATIRRVWQVGDVVTLSLPMPPVRMVAHPWIHEDAGRVALRRGPLLYCAEAADHAIGDVRDLVLADDAPIVAAWRPDLLPGGVVVLSATAELESPAPAWSGALYRTADAAARDRAGRSEAILTAIPYFAWANRGAGSMTVWLRREE
jgi:DUF1680 family protein